jgi:hypothetical protein
MRQIWAGRLGQVIIRSGRVYTLKPVSRRKPTGGLLNNLEAEPPFTGGAVDDHCFRGRRSYAPALARWHCNT